jgi:DNA-binding IclR family transcriptional regulator
MTDEELDHYLPTKELKAYTANTITDRETLKANLRKVAEQGYALDIEEMDIGVCCVGAPIRDYTRRIIGAVSISGPSMRFSMERIEKELVPLVKKAGEDISTKLGFHK